MSVEPHDRDAPGSRGKAHDRAEMGTTAAPEHERERRQVAALGGHLVLEGCLLEHGRLRIREREPRSRGHRLSSLAPRARHPHEPRRKLAAAAVALVPRVDRDGRERPTRGTAGTERAHAIRARRGAWTSASAAPKSVAGSGRRISIAAKCRSSILVLTMIDRVRLREMTEADWPQVAAIWAEGIATGNATFETEPPSWDVFDAHAAPEGRLVAEAGGAVVGWAALSRVSARTCYAGVAENSVYVASAARGQGVGGLLMRELVAAAGAAGIWTIQTSVFPENAASIALHERAGFRVVGRRERIAELDGVLAGHGVPGASPPVTRSRRTRVSVLVVPAAEDEARVVPAEAERVRHADLDLLAARLVRDVVEVAGRDPAWSG